MGITQRAHCRWRKEYASLRVDQLKRLTELDTEDARLERLLADQALDLAVLKKASWEYL